MRDQIALARNVEITGGFRNMAHFAQEVRQAAVTKQAPGTLANYIARIQAGATSPHNESVGADGGIEVPMLFREEIWALVWGDGSVLENFAPEPTASNQLTVGRDETLPWGSAGVKAAWSGESGEIDETKGELGPLNLRLNNLVVLVTATMELLEDAPRLNTRLQRAASTAIRYKLLEAIIEGNGVGRPLGYMNSASVIVVDKESGQAADTIVGANVTKMMSRCILSPRAFWMLNQDCCPQVMALSTGSCALWTPANGRHPTALGGYLGGLPVYLTHHCRTLGDLGDIQLVDPSGYCLVTRVGGQLFQDSLHLYFDTAEHAFRWTFRASGAPYLSEPITPKNGTNTQAHFVTLAARA